MQYNRKELVLRMMIRYDMDPNKFIEFAYMTDKQLRDYYINIYTNETDI